MYTIKAIGEKTCPNHLIISIGHLYLSGVWSGMVARTNTKKTRVQKKLGMCA